MTARAAHPVVALAAIAALGGAIALQVARDRWYPRGDRDSERLLYVRSGAALGRMALSYDALASDVYWIRAIQHYGVDRLGRAQTRTRYQLLYPLLDISTTLDPYFKIAYRFGAIFLAEPFPGGPGRPDQAIAILRKGIAAEPHIWQYYHDIAFVYYWRLNDLHSAAEWFTRAAEQPGAPNWLRPVAASMLSRGTDRAAARYLWQQILKADQEWLRRTAERSIVQLDAMDQMDQLEAAIRRVPPPPGEQYSWDLLIRKGVLRGFPADPTGAPYAIDSGTGRVTVSTDSPLFPMPGKARNPGR